MYPFPLNYNRRAFGKFQQQKANGPEPGLWPTEENISTNFDCVSTKVHEPPSVTPFSQRNAYITCAPVVHRSGIVWITIIRQLPPKCWRLQRASKCSSGFQRFGSTCPQTWKLHDTVDDPLCFFLPCTIHRLPRVPSLKVESLELLDESISFQCFIEPVIFRLTDLSWTCT